MFGLNQPQIILADEPTAHLDSQNSIIVLDILENLKKKGHTILITSHDERVKNHSFIDDIKTMKDGKII